MCKANTELITSYPVKKIFEDQNKMILINKILATDTQNFIISKLQKKIAKLSKTYFVPTSLAFCHK